MKITKYLKNLKRKIKVIYLAYKNKNTPFIAKVISLIAICYALSPIDFIPDFIPILGYLDDILILPLLIMLSLKLIPSDIIKECEIDAENIWISGKPKKFIYSLPIISLWIIIIVLVIKKLLI